MRELLHYLVTQGELVRINEEIILPAQTVQAGMELIKEFLSAWSADCFPSARCAWHHPPFHAAVFDIS